MAKIIVTCVLLFIVFVLPLILAKNIGWKPPKTDYEEENKPEQDSCENCIRWSECNGVDESCKWRG